MPRKQQSGDKRRGFGYIGRISNSGSQRVEAPISQNIKKGTSQVKTGSDLRTK